MKTEIKFFQRRSISSLTGLDTKQTKLNRKNLSTLSKGNRLNMYMSKFFRKFLLILASQPGIHFLSILILSTTLLLTGYLGWHILEMTLGIIIIRSLYTLLANPRPILATYLIRKHSLRVAEDEIKVSLALTALAFIMNWPITATPILIFIPINLAAQIIMMKGT